jgi:hypothetical protein
MARFGFSIRKGVQYRSVLQHFQNVYYYQSAVWTPTDANLSTIIDEIVTTEKKLHSSDVSFLLGQCWSAGGTPADNVMRVQKTLTGVGSGATNATFDRERAILIRWPAGVDTRGRPVYLRKWYHSCGTVVGDTNVGVSAVQQNTIEIPVAGRNVIAALAEELREVNPVETAGLCSKNGRANQGGAQCHRFLEHHQLGDEWR